MLDVDISAPVAAAVVATSLIAALIGGVTGMSTGIIAIPVLIFAFGIRLAVPIVTVAMLLNTLSRSVANRDYVDWRVARWYSLGAVPAAAVGGVVFANIPTDWLARGLGGFLLALVVDRHIPLLAGRAMPL
ncbi:MAG: sulfite exporter TauE/SafE family protein, partial [Chloroflexi bacterium]|nr:sulfite exporter TauE/SafE family protein [Chloroflexota bacterium]